MGALLWLTVAAPAVAAAVLQLLPAARARALAGLAAGLAAVPAWALLVAAADGETARSSLAWLPASGLNVGLRLDGLSAAMTAMVAAIGLVVVFYSTGYFAEHDRAPSALAGLLAFLAAMQGLVLADGFLALLIFWELVGALSARLIAFSREDPTAPTGAVRAFLMTRTADVGLYLAVFALFTASGSLAFSDVRPDGALGALIGVGLVVAAVGKSAQVPLHSWLAGAMAGPTPVSALLHSATMVAAGVYLLVRSSELLAGWPLELAGWIGAVTAVAGAAIALAQDDIKRVLAGSTSSQLGLMFVAAAAGGPAVAIFYLVAHAAGKAAMFLAVGLFQQRRGTTSLDELRGIAHDDRAAFGVFVIGAASIAAVPPLAVFWAKDAVLASTEHDAGWLVLAVLAAAGSAAYLLRPVLTLWRGAASGSPAPVGRGPMLAGATVLAGASVVLGLIGQPLSRLLDAELPALSPLGIGLSVVALAAGVGAALARPRVPGALRRAASEQLHADDAIRVVVQRPVLALANAADLGDRALVDRAVDGTARTGLHVASLHDRIERRGIDAAVDGIARLVGRSGDDVRRIQSGRLYEYLRDTLLGAAAIGLILVLTALF
jgi:NADH-quinone oxidoreductase subunit L